MQIGGNGSTGDRGLQEGKVELKRRAAAEAEMVALNAVLERMCATLT